MVGGPVYVFPREQVPDQRELTLVLTTARMESDEILDRLYYGRAYPNALIIVDPRDMASVIDDPDLLWMARRIHAAEALRFDLIGDPDAQKRVVDFMEGVNGIRQGLRDRLRDRYGAWRAPIYDPERGDLTFTRAEIPLERAAILRVVEQRYDVARFRQNVMEAVEARSTPPTVADVRADFLRQRSFAKPVWEGRPSDEPVDRAICDLVREARLEVVKGGDERYVCGRDPGPLQPQWTVAVPPETHKPRLQLGETMRQVIKERPQGITVQEVRTRLRQEALRFPGEMVDAAQVDAQLSDLLVHHEAEMTHVGGVPSGPLPDDLVIRPAQAAIPAGEKPSQRSEAMAFGAAPVPQIKTDVIRRVGKTDRLSEVTISFRCTLRGDDLADHHALLGLGDGSSGEASLTLSWTLRDTPVTDRDGLMAILNRLPHPHICEVTVQLFCEQAT